MGIGLMAQRPQVDYVVRMGIETILIVVGLIIVIAISVVTMKTKK